MRSLRAQYVERIRGLPGVVRCVAHDGELDDAEVARIGAQQTPAVYLSCLGARDATDELGGRSARLRWVAVVIARPPDRRRDEYDSAGDVAALIAMRIAYELAHGEPFGAALDRPADVRAANLVGARAQARGYALWAVTWEQSTEITPEELEPVLHDLRLIHTDYDLPPHPGVDMSSDTVMTEEP